MSPPLVFTCAYAYSMFAYLVYACCYMWQRHVETDEPAGGGQTKLKPFNGAFDQGPEQSILGCPGFIPQNRKQLQFVTSAACFTALCSTETTEENDVVTQLSWGWTVNLQRGTFLVIFSCNEEGTISRRAQCPQLSSAVKSWDSIYSSFIPMMHQSFSLARPTSRALGE